MARELVWRRAAIEYANGAEYSNGFRIQGALLNPGETLTRLRWQFLCIHADRGPADASGMAVSVGAIVGPASWTVSQVPGAWDSPQADWIWWETGFFTSKLDASEDGVEGSTGYYPWDIVYRDTKAQRSAAAGAGSRLWFSFQNSTFSPEQSRFWLCLSYSAGILLPP